MGLLVRMLERQKWEKDAIAQHGHTKTPADTITSDLKTSSNTLSLWKVEDSTAVLKGVLALAVVRNSITRLDIMIFEEQELIESGLDIKNTPENGHTPLEHFNDNHFDLVGMDYEKLGKLSGLIINNIGNASKCIRYDKAKIGDILYNGYINGDFLLEELNERLQKDLEKIIKKKQNV